MIDLDSSQRRRLIQENEELRKENAELRVKLQAEALEKESLLVKANSDERMKNVFRDLLAEERRLVTGLTSELEAQSRRFDEKQRSWEEREVALISHIEELREENKALRTKVAELERTNARLSSVLQRQGEKIDELETDLSGLAAEHQAIKCRSLVQCSVKAAELKAIQSIWPGTVGLGVTRSLDALVEFLRWAKTKHQENSFIVSVDVPFSYRDSWTYLSGLSAEKRSEVMQQLEKLTSHPRFCHLPSAIKLLKDSEFAFNAHPDMPSCDEIELAHVLFFCKKHALQLVQPLEIVKDFLQEDVFT